MIGMVFATKAILDDGVTTEEYSMGRMDKSTTLTHAQTCAPHLAYTQLFTTLTLQLPMLTAIIYYTNKMQSSIPN